MRGKRTMSLYLRFPPLILRCSHHFHIKLKFLSLNFFYFTSPLAWFFDDDYYKRPKPSHNFHISPLPPPPLDIYIILYWERYEWEFFQLLCRGAAALLHFYNRTFNIRKSERKKILLALFFPLILNLFATYFLFLALSLSIDFKASTHS